MLHCFLDVIDQGTVSESAKDFLPVSRGTLEQKVLSSTVSVLCEEK